MLLIRKQIVFILLCTLFVYVNSGSTYNSEQYTQDIDDYETQKADCSCKNGKCVNEGGKDICKCPPGFGNYSINFCKACECGPNKSCIWVSTGWFSTEKRCFCNSGYFEKKNGSCVGPCDKQPCQNGGTCIVGKVGYKCICQLPFHGPKCERDPCSSNPCQNNGICNVDGKGYQCDCKKPYNGITCEKVCDCGENGDCFYHNGKKTCACHENYKEDEGTCKICDCGENGDCSYQGGKKTCSCHENYIEDEGTCKNQCSSNPCKNDGKCRTVGTEFKCECKPSFFGKTCEEVLIEPCASNPCRNGGTCLTKGRSFQCKCKHPFFGKNCDKEMDLCVSNPCQNEGICIQRGSTFTCYCKPSYFGVVCEKDPCTENPCQNGGICVRIGYSFKCKCSHPFSGDICQYDACSDNPCFNGGTCIRDGNSFKCKCRYGYYGTICEKEGYESTLKATTESTSEAENTSISTNEEVGNVTLGNYTETTNELTNVTFNFNLTTIKPGYCARDSDCRNGGICRNSFCKCQPNFGGYRCEKNFLCERLQPTCRAMRATCKIVGFNAICDCPQDKMYHPKSGMCEDICDPWKCEHGRCEMEGRTFKCICDAGYTGYHCSEIVGQEVKVERFTVFWLAVTSVMVFICLLQIGQLYLFCQNRKFYTHNRDEILKEKFNSGLKSCKA